MKPLHVFFKSSMLFLALAFGVVTPSYSQCFQSGYKGEQILNSASGTPVSPEYRTNIIVGQSFTSKPSYSTQKSSALGYWSKLLTPPQLAYVKASDGDQPGRVVIQWGLAPNTSAETGGYNIYRDNILLTTVSTGLNTFIDYQVTPGIYYNYEVTAKNVYGEGQRSSDVGYVNANGSVTGRVTTFAGNSVEDVLVTLTPSNNLSLNFDGTGGLYIDTVTDNHALLVDSMFTVSVWMKARTFASRAMVLDYGKENNVNFWIETDVDNSVSFNLATSSGVKTVKHIFTVPAQRTLWHNVTGMYNGRELILYIDGQVITSIPVTMSEILYADHQLAIGALVDKLSNSDRFNGYIDDIRIIRNSQRTSQINKFLKNTLPNDYPGLVAYWRCDEGKGFKISNMVEKARFGLLCNTSFSTVEPGVKSSGVTNSSGYYVINNVNYGNGTTFTVTPSKFGAYNYALEFDRNEQQYAETPRFAFGNTSSLEVWFSPYVLSGVQTILSSKDTDMPIDIYLENDVLKINISGQIKTIGTIASTSYHMLTLVRNGNTITAYIDSDVASSQTLSFSPISSGQVPFWNLGASRNPDNFFFGLIDAVAVWNRNLTIPEIQLHNSNGVLSIDGQTDISCYLGLNEVTGTAIANDVLINGVTLYGTIYGALFTDNTAHSDGSTHLFNPNSRIVTLNIGNYSSDGQDFVDQTLVPISGVFKYENTSCFIQNAEVKVNGNSTNPPTYTDANGKWTVSLEPGSNAYISVVYQGHQVFPTFFEVRNAQTPKAGILFVDKTKRSVSGILAGGKCKKPIVPENGTAKILLTSTDGCFTQEFTVNDSNLTGAYQFANVPPLDYNIAVSQHTLSHIKSYFDLLGGKTVDLKSADKSDVNFIYVAPPEMELSQLDTNACGDVNLDMGRLYVVKVKVYEDYLGSKCYLDTAIINITDGIGVSSTAGFTGIDTMRTGIYNYRFYAGEANIVSPYLKATQIQAKVKGLSVTKSFQAVVIGNKKRATTFTTTTPQVPIMVLRDPPGDNSYSWIQKDSTFCVNNMKFSSNATSGEVAVNYYYGPDVTTSFGLGAETEFEVDVTADVSISVATDQNNQIITEKEMCASFSENITTSTLADDASAIGAGGDVYIGAALNIQYGMVDAIKYDSVNCSYSLYQEIIVEPKNFNTLYMYSQNHLLEDVIPTNYLLGDSVSAKRWESFIQDNNNLKNSATFVENRSWDAGVNYEKSQTTSKSQTTTTEFSLDLSSTLAGEIGVTVNGIGFSVAGSKTFVCSYGGADSKGKTVDNTVGYVFADDDMGDNFTVNIKSDKKYGTPVFQLVSGETMCPHENNTLPREGVQVLVDNNKESTKLNVSTDEAALFNLYLGNTSQSDEEQTYVVDVVNSSNPDGAVLTINGVNIAANGSGSGISYTLEANQGQLATLALQRGVSSNVYNYDGIELVFHSICDPEQIADTVILNAHFVEPCSHVDISSPLDNWVLTPADNGLLSITLDGYDETDPNLDLIRLRYRQPGVPTWINIKDIPADSLGAAFTTVVWNIGNLNDGNYEINATSVCSANVPAGYSELLPGIIERNPPQILGTPQPSDGIFNVGDEISVTFNEQINCNLLYADQFNLNNIGLYDKTTSSLINANVQCNGNKIIITPVIPMIYIENHTLEVRMTGIKDLAGNVMANDITGSPIHKWEFYVNVSPINWVGANVDEVKLIGTPHTFQRTISNTGGTNVNYTIVTPSYITCSSTSGVLSAGQQKVLTFTVDNQIGSGLFTGELKLKSSYGDEILPSSIRVMCAPPSWNVNASNYSFNMNFTVALDIEGFISQDQYDVVAGFIDGQVRGSANIQFMPGLNKYIAFLSVYGDAADNGKDVKFKVWDASECRLYELCYESFPFAANGQEGTPLTETVIHTKNILAHTLNLNAGWNWISFNLSLANDTVSNVFKALQNPSNGIVKSQTAFAQYYAGASTPWIGNLKTIDEKQMYQVKLNTPNTIDYYGQPLDVFFNPIKINVGWNWIGNLLQNGTPINTALKTLNPYNGDIIKNQYYFAQYVAGYGWVGNLTNLNPPSGYLLKSSVVDTLIYPEQFVSGKLPYPEEDVAKDKSLAEAFAKANLSPANYSGNMNVIAATLKNGESVTKPGDKLYAYINNELRGYAECVKNPIDQSSVFFMTVFGNEGEEPFTTISFKYLQNETNTLYQINEHLSYKENDLIGMLGGEQALTLGKELSSSTEEVKSLTTNVLSVFPNPSSYNAQLNIYAEEETNAVISVYDALGKRVGTKEVQLDKGVNALPFSTVVPVSEQAKGLYSITVTLLDKAYTTKLLNK